MGDAPRGQGPPALSASGQKRKMERKKFLLHAGVQFWGLRGERMEG